GQIRLLDGGVDVRVLVVVEDPEVPVQPDVHAGRLDHRLVIGFDADPLGVDLGEDVAVGEQHAGTLTSPRRLRPCRSTVTSRSATPSPRASATPTPPAPTDCGAGPTWWPRFSPSRPTTSGTPIWPSVVA